MHPGSLPTGEKRCSLDMLRTSTQSTMFYEDFIHFLPAQLTMNPSMLRLAGGQEIIFKVGQQDSNTRIGKLFNHDDNADIDHHLMRIYVSAHS